MSDFGICSPRSYEDDRALSEQDGHEELPVAEGLEDPGLDGAAHGQPHRHAHVADDAPPRYVHVLQSCDIKIRSGINLRTTKHIQCSDGHLDMNH